MFAGSCKSEAVKKIKDKRFTLDAKIKITHSRLILLLTFSCIFYKLSTNRRGATNTSMQEEFLPDDDLCWTGRLPKHLTGQRLG